MKIVTVTNGQLILSEEVLKHLGVDSGDKVAVDFLPGDKLELKVADRPQNDLDAFIGSLHDENAPVLTLEDIKRSIEEAWSGQR